MKIQRSLSAIVVAALALAGSAQARTAKAKKVVFILSSNEKRYTETRDVILATVKKAQTSPIETSEIVLDKDKSKAPDAVAAAAAKADILVPMGSVAAGAAAKVVKDKPIVFGHVFNPVEAGIVKDWAGSGNNVTGGSNYVPLSKVLIRLHESLPLRKIGVLYTPGEKQSEQHLAEYQKGAQAINAEVAVITVKDEKDAAAVGAQLKGLDAVFLTGGTPIGGNLKTIVEATIAARVPSAAHTDSFIHVHPGVLLGVTSTAAEIGEIAGEALARVLRGTPPSEIPVEFPRPQMTINAKTAKALGFHPSEGLKKWIARTFE